MDEQTLVGSTTVSKLKDQLEDDVQLNVLVIGVGNAGNQVIVLGKKEGMNVFAVNTSIKDLSNRIVDETIPSFIIGEEGRGAGKKIEKGLELWRQNGRQLFENEQFMTMCQDADLIIVTSATGGGTGPSISPKILETLQKIFPKKIIMYHGITPKQDADNVAGSNTASCLDKTRKLSIPYYLTDLSFYQDKNYEEAFGLADRHVIDTIKAVSGTYLTMSSSQMIDENDLKSIISEPGYQVMYAVRYITTDMLEKQSMQSMVIDKIKQGPAMMIQKDGISVQMGVIINTPDDMNEKSKTGDYSEIYQFIGHRPKNGVYENYGLTEGTNGEIIVILSGLTYPINRINQYIAAIKEQEEFLLKQKIVDNTSDVEAASALLSSNTEKLSSNTRASATDIASALDDLFS